MAQEKESATQAINPDCANALEYFRDMQGFIAGFSDERPIPPGDAQRIATDLIRDSQLLIRHQNHKPGATDLESHAMDIATAAVDLLDRADPGGPALDSARNNWKSVLHTINGGDPMLIAVAAGSYITPENAERSAHKMATEIRATVDPEKLESARERMLREDRLEALKKLDKPRVAVSEIGGTVSSAPQNPQVLGAPRRPSLAHALDGMDSLQVGELPKLGL